MKLYYNYDQEADVFYLSQGKPSIKDTSMETGDDVILRLDAKTKRVRGFTILNFSKRSKNKNASVALPIEAILKAA
jgi:uncharacterized protein YuzE